LMILLAGVGLSAEKIGNLDGVQSPYSLVVDGNELFFADDFAVHVYSLDPFRFKTKFGHKGTKPGEFQARLTLHVFPDRIEVSDWTKLSRFTRDGRLIQEKIYSSLEGFNPSSETQLIPLSNGYVQIIMNHGLNRQYLSLLDSEFKTIRELSEGLHDWNMVFKGMPYFRVLTYRIDVRVLADRIFISDNSRGFRISVFDNRGNLVRIIDKDNEIEKFPVDDRFKQKAMAQLLAGQPQLGKMVREKGFKFYKYFPLIADLRVDGGKIYAVTYKEGDGCREVIILNRKGRILKKTMVPFRSMTYYRGAAERDHFVIHSGILYELAQDESGVWGLFATEIQREDQDETPNQKN
jgi:hypothetical protein